MQLKPLAKLIDICYNIIINKKRGKIMSKKVKICKECGAENLAKAVICTSCGCKLPKSKSILSIIVSVFVAIIIISFIAGTGDDTSLSSSGDNINNSQGDDIDNEPQEIEYIEVSVDEMVSLLEDNALKAENTYQDAYVSIEGRLDVIDSDGKYISLYPVDTLYSFIGVTCYIENEQQLAQVLEMSKGDIVAIKGKVTNIGELLGYSLDIDEIL